MSHKRVVSYKVTNSFGTSILIKTDSLRNVGKPNILTKVIPTSIWSDYIRTKDIKVLVNSLSGSLLNDTFVSEIITTLR